MNIRKIFQTIFNRGDTKKNFGDSADDISFAEEDRSLVAPLERDGVTLGKVSTPSIKRLEQILDAWHNKQYNTEEMKKEFPEVEIDPSASYYEQGPEAYVAYMWNVVADYVSYDMPWLVPVINLAQDNPALKKLFPYTSMYTLCFSRFTGGHSNDCPKIEAVREGYCHVYGPSDKLLFEGTPEEAVRIAVDNLPDNCGPAVHGTGEVETDEVEGLITFLTKENIDCKSIEFSENTRFKGDMNERYFDPEIFIIKNEQCNMLYEAIVQGFRWPAEALPDKPVENYPYFIAGMEYYSSARRAGNWHFYDNKEQLAEDFNLDSMQDNFDDLRQRVYSELTYPAGPMNTFLGGICSHDELLESEYYNEAEHRDVGDIRAYKVDPFYNTQFTITHQNQLNTAVNELMKDKLPGIEWTTHLDWTGPFRKYFIIHNSIPAPADSLTGESMFLEIYGELVEVDGMELNSEEGVQWREARDKERAEAERNNQPWPEISGKMVIEIKSAVYSNIKFPGIGVPLYM